MPLTNEADPRLGQVFTPAPLADLTLRLALEGMSRPRILDPACGDGAFLSAALRAGIIARDVWGIDIDPTTLALARSRCPGVALEQSDFLNVALTEFDAVVGNPPYVRQELLGTATKQRIAAQIEQDWPGVRLGGRADLALAFVARALRFVRLGGRVGFVLSQAALETKCGAVLRDFLRGRGRLVSVIASPHERWFPDAAIHAAIVILEREGRGESSSRFVRLNTPVSDVTGKVKSSDDLPLVGDVRWASGERAWTIPLRAPAAWFDVEPYLVPLGELCEIWRGTTSGANDFFYLNRANASGIEPELVVPLFKTPRDAESIEVDPQRLPRVAFVCRDLKNHPGAASYVTRNQGVADRKTLTAREPWWSLPARPAQVFLTKAYDTRFVQFYSQTPLLADQRVYAAAPRDGDAEFLAALLNGTLTAFAIESLGRASLGDGVLEGSVEDMRALPVVDPRRFSIDQRDAIKRAFRVMKRRRILRVNEEINVDDRRALDEALLQGEPKLSSLLPDVRNALVESVTSRIRRSRR